ncbi:MAG: DUF6644 family protein [Gammaproteobacteria bacterium]|nr:hypothetical protein [Pseudomonadales bacterium]MCP5345727.1 hypothetical protein [Pseudomonadales bacterium]
MSTIAATSMLGTYRRTIIVSVVVLGVLFFSMVPIWPAQECVSSGGSDCLITLRRHVWVNLFGFFGWMETTWFGVIGKTWGAAFAIVEAFHLLAMALLGGAVFVADARLLGIGFKDIPADEIVEKAHRVFVWGLGVVLFTGVFMACGVAGKIYYLPVFWYKMLALATGILFVFFIKRPLLARGVENISPLTTKVIAVSSIMVWVTVAATGRWIGFAGS